MDLTDRVDELEREVARHREVEELLRTTLLTAERASQDVREDAKREAGTILEEAHREARTITNDARREREQPARRRPPRPHAARRRRSTPSTTPTLGDGRETGAGGPPGGVGSPCLYLVSGWPSRRRASGSGSRPEPGGPSSSAGRATPGRSASPRRPSAAARTTLLLELLAERLRVAPAELTLVAGRSGRDKVVELRGLGAEEADRRLEGAA